MTFNFLAGRILQRIWVREDGVAILNAETALPQPEPYDLEVVGDSFIFTDAHGQQIRGNFAICKDEIILLVDGYSYRFTQLPEAAARQEEPDNEVVADLPGKVIRLPVKPGEQVTAESPLVVLEAMKMEHTLRAKVPCEVVALLVSEGEQVQVGQVLLTLKPVAEPKQGKK